MKAYKILMNEPSYYLVYAESLEEAKKKALKCEVDLESQDYQGMQPIISSIRRSKENDANANEEDN